MSHCVLKSCKNYAAKIKKDGGISYYRFPSDPARRSKWIDIVTSAHDNDFIPSKSGRVCSQHFLQSDMYTTDKGIRKLKSDAVPSIIEKYIPGKYPIGRPRKYPKVPPKPKRPKNITAKLPESKVIITTVYYYLQNEYEKLKKSIDGCDLRPLENILQRTAKATGVVEEVVTAILERDHRPKDVSNDPIPEESGVLCNEVNDCNDSSIEEEASCESGDNDQYGDNSEQQKQKEFDLETVKMEVVDEFEAHMAVNHSLPSRHPEIKVKIEPSNDECLQSQHQLQASSSVHSVASNTTSAQIKMEPSDDGTRKAHMAVNHSLPSRHPEIKVKIEPSNEECLQSQHQLQSRSTVHHVASNTTSAQIKMKLSDDNTRNNIMEVPSNNMTYESIQPKVKSEPDVFKKVWDR